MAFGRRREERLEKAIERKQSKLDKVKSTTGAGMKEKMADTKSVPARIASTGRTDVLDLKGVATDDELESVRQKLQTQIDALDEDIGEVNKRRKLQRETSGGLGGLFGGDNSIMMLLVVVVLFGGGLGTGTGTGGGLDITTLLILVVLMGGMGGDGGMGGMGGMLGIVLILAIL